MDSRGTHPTQSQGSRLSSLMCYLPSMTVPINVFRRSYTQYAQSVKFENAILSITRYGRIVAYFVSPEKLQSLQLTKTEEHTAETFRNKLGSTWERLYSGEIEAMYVTHHDRKRGALISLKLGESLGIQHEGAIYDG